MKNHYVICVRRQCSETIDVTGEYRAAGFRRCDHDRVNGRPFSSCCTKSGGATGKVLGKVLSELANLEEPVGERTCPLAAAEALHEDDRRDQRRPDSVLLEDRDDRSSFLALPREPTDPTGVEDELAQEVRAPAPCRRTCCDSPSARLLPAELGSPTFATSSSR